MTATLETLDLSDLPATELAGGQSDFSDNNADDPVMAILNGEPTEPIEPAEPAATETPATEPLDDQLPEYPDAFETPVELPDLTDAAYHRRLREAQENYCQAGIEVEHAKNAIKQAKESQKAALEWLEKVMAESGDGQEGSADGESFAAQSVAESPTDDASDPSGTIADWRSVPTEELKLDTIKGMGTKKLEAIIHEYPTVGKLEDLRAEGNGKFMGLQTIKGVGEAMAGEIENKILEWLSANRDAAVLADAAASSEEPTADPKPTKRKKPAPKVETLDTYDVDDADWEDAIEQCDRILSDCDDVPEAGDDFAYSVRENVEGIKATIEEKEYVTPDQQSALDNMESGVRRWLDD
jgi:DNA uptake protein ComE-like DNA-binding protein